jgi:hypothetical protein
MAFGNYEIKADFGGQRITDRNSATAFMLTLTAIYRNKPHWKLADQALRQASKSAAAESRASAAFKQLNPRDALLQQPYITGSHPRCWTRTFFWTRVATKSL